MAKRLPSKPGFSAKVMHHNVDAVGLGDVLSGKQQSDRFAVFQDLGHRMPVGNERQSVSEVKVSCENRIGSAAVRDFKKIISVVSHVSGSDDCKFQEYSRGIAPSFPFVIDPAEKRCSSQPGCQPGSKFATLQCFPPLVGGSCRGTRILSAEGLSLVFRGNKKHPAVTAAGCGETKTNGKQGSDFNV